MAGRLEGVRVLVTRPRERAEELCFLLEDEGAQVMQLPLLELRPPEDPRPLQSAAEQVQRYRWLLFASASGVEAFHEAMREAGTLDRVRKVKVAVVGPGTAKAARALGFEPAVEAEKSTGEGLFERIREELEPQDELLLPAAQEGRPELAQALEEAGFRVTRVAAYQSGAAPVDPAAQHTLRTEPPHAVLFGSPRTAESFLEALGEEGRALLGEAKVVAIGPTTASALAALGFSAAAVAARPTAAAWVEATVSAVGKAG